MPEYGFPSQPRQFQMSRIIQDLRARSDDARVSTVTGFHADPTRALGGRVDEMLQLEQQIDKLSAYGETIALTEGRAATTQASLQQLITLSTEVTGEAEIVLSGTSAQRETFSQNTAGHVSTIVSALNVTFAGRVLMSGDAGDQAALADADTILTNITPVLEGAAGPLTAYNDLRNAFFDTGGLFETTLYTGGTGTAPEAEVAPGETVAYAVRADDPALRETVFNMTVLAVANDRTNGIADDQRAALTRLATDALRTNHEALTAVSARLGNAEARFATAKARNIASEAALSISLAEFKVRDPFDATVELTTLEEQLEATFLATARLSNLSLTNFL